MRADPQPALCLVVEPDEVGEGRARPELQLLVRTARRQPQEGAPRSVEPADLAAQRAIEERQHSPREVRVFTEQGDLVLKDCRPLDDIGRRSARRWVAGCAPGVDRLAQGGVVLLDLIGELLRRRRGGGAPTAHQSDRYERPGGRDKGAKGPTHLLH
jgi:hypothetical protein